MSKNSSFCILPFAHLATHPNGNVTPCCESKLYAKNGDTVLALGVDSIEEIRGCESFTQLRNDMLDGVLNTSCNFCYEREKSGLESKRIRENKHHKVDFTNLDKYKDLTLTSVELRLGNICNAKCVICHPGSSSKWNEDINNEILNLNEGYNKHTISNTWFREDDFYKELLEHSTFITHLWFNGGEPLLIKEHLKFLHYLVENSLSSNIELEYHTNGSLINEKIIKLWSNFKFVKVTLSLDDIEKRFHYSRFPLQFRDVENGIKLLVQNNIHYDIIPTINILNVFNTTGIYEYFYTKYKKECQFNYLRFPKFQNISNLPEIFKARILTESRLPEVLYTQLKYELYSQKSTGITKALHFYKALDKQRGTDIVEYLEEFNELIEYEQREGNII